MEYDHALVELHIWLGDKVLVVVSLCLESSFVPGDLLYDLEVNLKFDQRDRCRIDYLKLFNPAF